MVWLVTYRFESDARNDLELEQQLEDLQEEIDRICEKLGLRAIRG